VQNAYLAYAAPAPNVDLSSLLEQATAAVAASASFNMSKFVVLLRALQQFLQAHEQQPPLLGKIPDMTASTELYVQLQTLYREQALTDVQEMKQYVNVQLAASTTVVTVSDKDLITFCQNVNHLDIVPSRLVRDETLSSIPIPQDISDDLNMTLQEAVDEGEERGRPDMVPMLWYFGLQAVDMFYQQQERYPGVVVVVSDDNGGGNDDYKADVPLLQSCLVQVLERYRVNLPSESSSIKLSNMAEELCRYGNAELHNVAAIVGGVARQETIKLITSQYIPFHHTYVYTGIASSLAIAFDILDW
jgi:amyloid beta precursor protein binding protein 1